MRESCPELYDSATDDPEGKSICERFILTRYVFLCPFRSMKRGHLQITVISFHESKTLPFFLAGSTVLPTRVSIQGEMEINCKFFINIGGSSPAGLGRHKMGYLSYGLGEIIPQTGL